MPCKQLKQLKQLRQFQQLNMTMTTIEFEPSRRRFDITAR